MNRILAATRYAVVVPAIASILGALLLMVQGSIEMVRVIIDAIINSTKLKLTIVEVLTAVDAILLGTVLLVIGYGLYELFIDEDLKVPVWLQVHDLDDLKSKLIGVVIRGETAHFDYVCQGVTDGVMQVSLSRSKPIGFGVLMCETVEQAEARAGFADSFEDKGFDSAVAALSILNK